MTTRTTLRGLSLLLLAGWLGQAGAAQDLLATYRQAMQGDPQLAQARAQLEAERARLDQARALFFPSVAVEADYYKIQENQQIGRTPTQDRDYRTHSYGIGLTQPLFRAESFPLYDQAELLIVQSELAYANTLQDLAQRVTEAYFRVLQARNDVATFDSELAAIEQQLKRTRRAFELGTGTVTDINEAQARFDLTTARQLSATNELLLAREALRRITDQPVDELAPLSPDFAPELPQPQAGQDWASIAERENLQVKQTQAAFELAQKEISRQKAQRYPKVDLVARYGQAYQGYTGFGLPGAIDSDRASVGVTLSMPLYTGGLVSAQVREAEAAKNRSLAEVAEVKRAASLAAEQAFLSLRSSQLQIKALEQALRSMVVTEHSIQKGLELGLRSTVDLLDAQRERYAAERDLAAARHQFLLSWLRLRAAVGEAAEPAAVEYLNQFLAGE